MCHSVIRFSIKVLGHFCIIVEKKKLTYALQSFNFFPIGAYAKSIPTENIV